METPNEIGADDAKKQNHEEIPNTQSVPAPGTPNSSSSTFGMEELEERYNKLKAITIKYKKKIAEQTAEIQGLTDSSKFRNASKIQQEYDNALDEIERIKKNESMLQKDLQKAVDENVNLKMREADNTAQIHSLSSSHKALRDKLDKFENDSDNTVDLRAKAESLEKELQEVKEAQVEAQQEKRQLQILSLEVSDYEKKMQDLHGNLEEKKVECDKLYSELVGRDQKVKDLEGKISNLVDSENKLILIKESLQADVSRRTEKMAFLQDEIGKLNDRLNDKKTELEGLKLEFETAKTNFATTSKDLTEKLNASQRQVDSTEKKVCILEENKRNRETQITNLKLEVHQLESDYFNYKTKAQAMLKSQKPATANADINDETDKLQKVVQDLHSEISILKTDLKTLKYENENLSMEKADLNLRFHQMKTDSIEKEVQLNSELQQIKQNLRQTKEALTSQLDFKNNELETIKDSFKNEVQSLKSNYESQIQLFREQYELLKSERENVSKDVCDKIIEGNFRPISTESSPSANEEFEASISNFQGRTFNRSQPLTIDTSTAMSFEQLRMIPRGEGEGSESANTVSAYTPRLDNYNISFEQLLSTSFDSVSKGSDSENDKTLRESFQHELTRCQHQITHLTSVLRESESNCDRLAQLSEALKEEIRRIERDKERQEHLKENKDGMEYLKNILLRFITLTGEAERHRLIPVLKTMLKLTNEEVQTLETAIKGKNGKDSNGWSNYLWGGGSGSAGDK